MLLLATMEEDLGGKGSLQCLVNLLIQVLKQILELHCDTYGLSLDSIRCISGLYVGRSSA